jgi:ferredoxin
MSNNEALKTTGAPSLEELLAVGQLASEEEMEGRGCLCIECIEEIPCNPCQTSCPQGAITVGFPITNLPVIDRSKCTVCGLCIPACPGQAITIKSVKNDKARIRFPWEYLPFPSVGDSVRMVDRLGQELCDGRIVSITNPERNNKTAVITAEFPRKFVQDAISIARSHTDV